MTRPAIAALLFILAMALTGCRVPLPPGAAPTAVAGQPPVDTECVGGMAFVHSYSAIAGRYDPQLESDRQQLAATHFYATARSLLADIASTLQAYDGELGDLKPPSDFADQLAALLEADQQLRQAALTLAASSFGSSDQSAFGQVATNRQAALHDLRLQVAFVNSECA